MKSNSLCFAILFIASPLLGMEESDFFSEFFSFVKEAAFSVRITCGKNPSDQLFSAIREKNVTEVMSLLAEHPQLSDNATDENGMTPLLAATVSDDANVAAELVTEILKKNPYVDRCADQGFAFITMHGKSEFQSIARLTPLIAAVKLERIDLIRKLSAAGAKKDLEDSHRKSALDYAKEKANISLVCLLH